MSSHYLSSHYGGSHYASIHFGGVVPFTPEPVHPPGAGRMDPGLRRRILEEDETIMAVIMAFLQIKDD